MSSNEKQPPVNPAAQQGQQGQTGQQPYFPPPPPGPPPVQTSQPAQQPPKHTNETPIPDYDIPTYNPAHPQYAPPLNPTDNDIYNASPTDAHAPKWGFHHHQHESDGEGGKKKSNRLSGFGSAFTSKVAGPVNALANKFGSEGFLPESLDKECEKAARILRGFCKDGIYTDATPAQTATTTTAASATTKPPPSPTTKPTKKPRTLLTIPPKVIARAQGLAIFTAVRLGFQATGSSGSGILLARLPDGRWSPPSGIQITSVGAGFVAGVDIYDCVIVINTREALDMFTKTRLSLGSDLAVTAGPVGLGGMVDWGVPAGGDKQRGREGEGAAGKKVAGSGTGGTLSPPPLSADNTRFQTGGNVPEDQQGMGSEEEDAKDRAKKDRRPSPFREAIKKPVYSYVKSRGLYAGVQIDGTVIAEREGGNSRFYGQAVPVGKILRGEVPAQGPAGMWPAGAKGLYEVLKGAEALPSGPAPVVVGAPTPTFGAAPGTGGAPPSAWVPPPAPAQGVAGVTAGVRNLGVGDNAAGAAAGPSTGPSAVPPPPATAGASSAKAAEAASEAARAEASPPPPPVYSEHHAGEDLPPAYVEDERYRPAGGDSKTGLH